MAPATVRKTAFVLTALLALALVFPRPAHAVGPANKLVRGVVNLSTGWLEIPHQMAERKEDGTVVLWAVHGFIYGTIMGFTRTLYGLVDTLTFPIPPYDSPLMEPDTLIAPKHGPEKRSSDPWDSSAPSTPTTNVNHR